MDWTALEVSLRLGAGTIALLLPFGIWFGRLLAIKEFPGKLLVEALVTVPLAFVVGIVVSLLRPEPAAAVGFDAAASKMHLG